jgi:hypothetical protein
LPEAEEWLAWKSLDSEAFADSAVQLGSFTGWMIVEAARLQPCRNGKQRTWFLGRTS